MQLVINHDMRFGMRYIQNLVKSQIKRPGYKTLALKLMVETRGIEPLTS